MSTELTPKAEALREKLKGISLAPSSTSGTSYTGRMTPKLTLSGSNIEAIARTIVGELGVTEEHLKLLVNLWSLKLHKDDRDALNEIAVFLSTLLELASEVRHGE